MIVARHGLWNDMTTNIAPAFLKKSP